jgi:hypothetical protein
MTPTESAAVATTATSAPDDAALRDDAGLTPDVFYPPAAAGLPGELTDPLTGECVPADDPDALIDAYERLRLAEGALTLYRQQLTAALAGLVCAAETRTRRVRGRRRRARLELPPDSWDQARLREAWERFPHLAGEVLQIQALRVRVREWRKLQAEVGPPDFQAFKSLLAEAHQGVRGLPRVTIEE